MADTSKKHHLEESGGETVIKAHREPRGSSEGVGGEDAQLDRDLDAELAHLLEQVTVSPAAKANGSEAIDGGKVQLSSPTESVARPSNCVGNSSWTNGAATNKNEAASEAGIAYSSDVARTSGTVAEGSIGNQARDNCESHSQKAATATLNFRSKLVKAASSRSATEKYCGNKGTLLAPLSFRKNSRVSSRRVSLTYSTPPQPLAWKSSLHLAHEISRAKRRISAVRVRRDTAAGVSRRAFPASKRTGGPVSASATVSSLAAAAKAAFGAATGGAPAAVATSSAIASGTSALRDALSGMWKKSVPVAGEVAPSMSSLSKQTFKWSAQEQADELRSPIEVATAARPTIGTNFDEPLAVTRTALFDNASSPRRRGKLRSRGRNKRKASLSESATDFGNLDPTWELYPRDRRRNDQHNLHYSFAKVLFAPPNLVNACVSPSVALPGHLGETNPRNFAAPLTASYTIRNALSYRTPYERPRDHVVGMRYNARYQLPTLSRLLSAKEPEFLQNHVAAAKELKQRWRWKLHKHSRQGAQQGPAGIKFRLLVVFSPRAVGRPLKVEGKIFEISDEKNSSSIHAADDVTHTGGITNDVDGKAPYTATNRRVGRCSSGGVASAASVRPPQHLVCSTSRQAGRLWRQRKAQQTVLLKI